MTPATKALLMKLVKSNVSATADDYYRTNHAMAGYLPREMDEQYYESGRTRREVLTASKEAYDQALTAQVELGRGL